jgi:MATE family multidrug resistance protein
MPPSESAPEPTYGHILRMAWPIILANASSPLLGLVDTAVIGHTRPAAALGAIAIGSLVLNFIYWAFGFLRMSTTGFVAQAMGAGDSLEVRSSTLRAICTGTFLGLGIVFLQVPLGLIGFYLMAATEEITLLGQEYFALRVWAAPATLLTFAVSGALIGLGRTRQLLVLQLILNGLNILLDVIFAGVLDWGVRGIALGTLIAEWTAAIYALFIIARILREHHVDGYPFIPWFELGRLSAIRGTFIAQGNIMIRTLAMLAGFAWFTRQGAALGETTLAANHILLSLIGFCAFFLDGFALPAESLVGHAQGSRNLSRFDQAVTRTTVLAVASAITLALILLFAGPFIIAGMTDLTAVQSIARNSILYAAAYVALSVFAFQLDGIFIGTTHTREMRNASLISAGIFIASSAYFVPTHGLPALWLTFIAYVIIRALTLALQYPALRHQIPNP